MTNINDLSFLFGRLVKVGKENGVASLEAFSLLMLFSLVSSLSNSRGKKTSAGRISLLVLDATSVHLLVKLSAKLLLCCLQFVEEDERRDRGDGDEHDDEDNVDDRFMKGGGESGCWMIRPSDKLRSVVEIGVTHVVGLMMVEAVVIMVVALLLLSLVMDIIVFCWC